MLLFSATACAIKPIASLESLGGHLAIVASEPLQLDPYFDGMAVTYRVRYKSGDCEVVGFATASADYLKTDVAILRSKKNDGEGNESARSSSFLFPKKPQFLWEEEVSRSIKNPSIPQFGGISERSANRRGSIFFTGPSSLHKKPGMRSFDGIPGLYTQSYRLSAAFFSLIAACAAARRAMGTR